jgi:hypothetical protein
MNQMQTCTKVIEYFQHLQLVRNRKLTEKKFAETNIDLGQIRSLKRETGLHF